MYFHGFTAYARRTIATYKIASVNGSCMSTNKHKFDHPQPASRVNLLNLALIIYDSLTGPNSCIDCVLSKRFVSDCQESWSFVLYLFTFVDISSNIGSAEQTGQKVYLSCTLTTWPELTCRKI